MLCSRFSEGLVYPPTYFFILSAVCAILQCLNLHGQMVMISCSCLCPEWNPWKEGTVVDSRGQICSVVPAGCSSVVWGEASSSDITAEIPLVPVGWGPVGAAVRWGGPLWHCALSGIQASIHTCVRSLLQEAWSHHAAFALEKGQFLPQSCAEAGERRCRRLRPGPTQPSSPHPASRHLCCEVKGRQLQTCAVAASHWEILILICWWLHWKWFLPNVYIYIYGYFDSDICNFFCFVSGFLVAWIFLHICF